MIGHWDDVQWVAHEHGELRCERQRLGAAAGSVHIGLSRYRVPPGHRPMPQHAHVDEEEICFVLSGSGLSWAGDAVHGIGAGDAIVYLAGAPAHTLVASDDEPLDVLVFASGSPTGLTSLPRAGVTWVGPRWLPEGAPHPFESEPAVDALPPLAPRPSTIVALADVEARSWGQGRVAGAVRNIGGAAGSRLSGLRHEVVAAGKRSSPRHCHSLEEEIFVVLDGSAVVLLGDDEHPVRRGSIVARPAGTGVAHAFEAGPGGLTLLAYGTRESADMCWYPDSQKIAFRGLKVIGRFQTLDYWDGEH